MKKLISLIAMAAIGLVFTAGNALAYFEDGNLIRIVYSISGDLEVATDLGAWSGIGENTAIGDDFTSLTGTNYADLQVAYMMDVDNTSYWFSSQLGVTPVTNTRTTPQNFTIQTTYGLDGSSMVAGSKANTGSYFVKMDNGGNAVGKFSAFYVAELGEANLADLATVGYVDQSLFYFASKSTAGVEVAVIRTMADGTTIINPGTTTETPVPASLLLFGSGLLGLVGVRRKTA